MTAAERALRPAAQRVVLRHSALTRICHWINAVCFFALLMSGLQIFNAHPALNFGQTTDFARPLLSLAPNGFPSWATLPEAQDLAVGRRWHFFFAWALVLNGAVYLGDLAAARRHSPPVAERKRSQRAFRARSSSTRGCAFPRATRRCATTCCRSSPISPRSPPFRC